MDLTGNDNPIPSPNHRETSDESIQKPRTIDRMNESQLPSAIHQVIRQRKTTKALSETPFPIAESDALIDEVVSAAAWAPFHKPADSSHQSDDLSGVEPWRCYTLDSSQCRDLRERLLGLGDNTKIPKMLAVSEALIQVTWLPKPSDSPIPNQTFSPTRENTENIAAASAAVQNMLLTATARNVPNYWSSGGILRSLEIFNLLGIPQNEILLGSIFLFPQDLENAQLSPGALRAKRSEPNLWSRKVTLVS